MKIKYVVMKRCELFMHIDVYTWSKRRRKRRLVGDGGGGKWSKGGAVRV